MKEISHQELKEIVKVHYNRKLALLLYGRYGIGKSEGIIASAKDIAKNNNREFVEWNKTNEEKKKEIFANPKKYFVLIDIRLSEFAPEDLKGLPEFTDGKRAISWRVPYWALLMEKEDSDGILFFDELANAVQLIQFSCYKILYDRIINESCMSHNWGIIGCSNVIEDKCNINEIAPALRDRASEYQLIVPDTKTEWIPWAISHKINPWITGFLNMKPSYLWKVDDTDNAKATTPRGWARVDTLIKGMTNLKLMELIGGGAITEGIFSEFLSFIKVSQKLDLERFIRNPTEMEDITDISIKYFLISVLAERYKSCSVSDKDNKEKTEKLKKTGKINNENGKEPVDFNKIAEISRVLIKMNNEEFAALLWNFCSMYAPEQFKKDIIESDDDEIIDKFGGQFLC